MVDFFCNCCNGTGSTTIYTGLRSVYSSNDWTVASCTTCDNIITQPVPEHKTLEDIYANTYLYPVHHLILSEKKMRAKDLAKYIRTIITGRDKTVFEVGCMYGYLLNELKDDHSVKGIEIGEDAVDYCKRQGLNVMDINLETYLLNFTEKFDVIILSHVFEHLLQCDSILKQLRDRLNQNGCLILLVPNSNSVSRKVFGRNWGWWQVPVHINHFSEKPLRILADKSGLSISHVRFKGGDSLMLLLNFINLFRFHKSAAPGRFQKLFIKIWTKIFRYWYFLGNEEITVVMQKK